nr:hypothetical protein [Myxococcota bacterium]
AGGSVPGGSPQTPSVTGSAAIGGGAGVDVHGSSSVSSSAGVGSSADSVTGAPGDATQQLADAQFQGSTTSAEAGIYRGVGPDGKAVVKGGAQGVSERNLPGESDVDQGARELENVERGQAFEARGEGRVQQGAAVDATGYRDPVSEAGRAEQLELNQRDRVAAHANAGTEPVDRARRTAADPGSAASAEVGTRAGVDPTATRAEVDAVQGAADDPSGAVRERAQSRIADEKRDAAGSAKVDVGVSGSGSASASTSTTKPGDKK